MLVVLLHLAATETAKPFMQCTKEHLRPTDDDNGGWFIEPACTELRLAMQMMGDDGVLAMAESLKAHKKLKLLELAFNEIFDEGAVALAAWGSPQLQRLFAGLLVSYRPLARSRIKS